MEDAPIATNSVVEYNGASFHTRSWSPPAGITPIGNLLFVYGFSEHLSNYDSLAEYFCPKGYNFFIYDQRGFGNTSLGKSIAVTDDFHTFDDLDFFINRLITQSDFTGKLFLLGHSMGGGIVLNYAVMGTHKKELTGVIACAPEILLHPYTSPNIAARMILPVLSAVVPRIHVYTGLDVTKASHDKVFQKQLAEDKLSPMICTFRQMHHMIRRGVKLLDYEYSKSIEKSLPVLIQHGTGDEINDIKGSRLFIEHGFKNVKLLEYSGAYHVLYKETEEYRKQIFGDLLKFLQNPQSVFQDSKL